MSDQTGEFSLHALAVGIIQHSRSAQPSDMAAELVARIPPEYLDEALQQMAREYIRTAIHSVRNVANRPQSANPSRRVDAARDAWRRMLDMPEFVPSLNAWVHLKDATREQVLEMANMRLAKAAENAAVADRYKALAAHMKRLRAGRVADLPEDVLASAIVPKAAAA